VILVAGGTGRLGSLLVARLAERGVDVRVLTRDAQRAQHLEGIAADITVGDVRDRASVERAVQGVDLVVSAVQGFAGPGRVTPVSVDERGNATLVDAAVGVGADVVLMSVVGASADSPLELFRAKHAAERHLQASPTGWTIVRASAFVELWAQIMARPIVFGRGDNPINFVAVADVVDVVEAAVVDPSRRGQIIEVGGPANLTFNELAALMQDIRGDHARVRHVPRWLLSLTAPFVRPTRAALAMDTVDLSYTPRGCGDGHGTDMRTALSRAFRPMQPHP